MIFAVDNLLTLDELKFIVTTLEIAEFVDGKVTAGWYAKSVKNNTQLDRKDNSASQLQEIIKTALKRNFIFQLAVQPKAIHSILFSRYDRGMSYGKHCDNAFMGKEQFLRSDVSFSVFLNSPQEYEGGELVIEKDGNENRYKLDAGSAIVYPASTLHEVTSVTSGFRLVAVGWVQSLVRDPNDREILFDLDTVRRSIYAKEGKTVEFDLLAKTYANLLRKWGE
jgi:PKHD-type hydroxylase